MHCNVDTRPGWHDILFVYVTFCEMQRRILVTDSTPSVTIQTAVTLARVNIVYTGASSMPSVTYMAENVSASGHLWR
jgi:hypothetical protein